MSAPVPRPLYLYRPHRSDLDREHQILIENKVWFSTPNAFNDPFEARPQFLWPSGTGPSRADLLRASDRFMPGAPLETRTREVDRRLAAYQDPEARAHYQQRIEQEVTDLFQATSIACFARSGTDIKMWSYYASGHAGYCLGFSFDEPWIYEDPASTGKVRLQPMEVRYQGDYPAIDAESNWRDGGVASELVVSALMTKAEQWSFEGEWRCFRPSMPSGHQVIPASALREVILGARMPEQRASELIALIRGRGMPVTIYRANAAASSFRLELVALDSKT